MNSLKKQVGGSHYHLMRVQPVKLITTLNLNFLEGSFVKYIARYPHKGQAVEDLQKAVHYLELIGDFSTFRSPVARNVTVEKSFIDLFVDANGMGEEVREILMSFHSLISGEKFSILQQDETIKKVRSLIEKLKAKEKGVVITASTPKDIKESSKLHKEWRDKNKKHLKKYRKDYREKNLEDITEYQQNYYIKNREVILERAKKFQAKKKAEKIKADFLKVQDEWSRYLRDQCLVISLRNYISDKVKAQGVKVTKRNEYRNALKYLHNKGKKA